MRGAVGSGAGVGGNVPAVEPAAVFGSCDGNWQSGGFVGLTKAGGAAAAAEGLWPCPQCDW